MKLEDPVKHEYFVNVVEQLTNVLGINFTRHEIEQMCIDDTYFLHIAHKKLGKWHLGIWAVGRWGLKSSYAFEGETTVYDSGYGVDLYKPLTVSVFLLHDWNFDKFRPTYSDWEELIDYNDNDKLSSVSNELLEIVNNPIDSYYDIVDKNSYDGTHKVNNKYKAYFKAYYENEIVPRFKKAYRRVTGYLSVKILQCISHFDNRVVFFKHSFHSDKWNPEYEIAMVFEFGISDWHDWLVYNFYRKIETKLRKFSLSNIFVNYNYLDENDEMPDCIWRGIYWENEPYKDNE